MQTVVEAIQTGPTPSKDPIRKQIRGSGLLLAGRILAVGINFLVQVLIVRYLSKMDYGAFAYALSVVAFFQHGSSLGLRVGIPRFVPIFHEQKEYSKLLGTIVLGLISAVLASFVIVVTTWLSPGLLSRLIDDGQHATVLLLVLIFVVPMEALDDVLMGTFASFHRSRTIFTRRHLMGPLVKLLAIALTMALKGSALFLACSYVLGSALGVVVYLPILLRLLRGERVLEPGWTKNLQIPAAEVFRFSLPLLMTDLLVGMAPLVSVMVLGYYYSLDEVALFRAVVPFAAVNRIVRVNFETLYSPTAARLFAVGDFAKMNEQYWRTAAWVAVLTFPIFAATFCVARPMLLFLYGPAYEAAWPVLALLSVSQYCMCAMGYSAVTLQVLGKVRFVVILDVLASVLHMAASFALIPRFGIVGAAFATTGTVILMALVRQIGLARISHISFFDKRYRSLYTLIIVSATLLFCLQWTLAAHLYLLIPLGAASIVTVLLAARRTLNVAETFPEVMKFRLARAVFA